MRKYLLSIATILTLYTGAAQTFTQGDFTYQIAAVGDTVILEDYDVAGGGTDVVIPSSVTHNATIYAVGYIGYQAFMSKNITSVVIPNSVRVINNGAFLFNSLTSVDIPSSVTVIGSAAFGSNQLTTYTIGNNISIFGENVFNGNQLTSFTLPSNLTEIPKQTFANNNISALEIPAAITAIGQGAFGSNPLVSVTSFSVTPPDIFTASDISDSFDEDRSAIDLFIPAGTTGPYVTDLGAEWTGFNSVTEMTSVGLNESFLNIDLYPNPMHTQLNITSQDPIDRVEIMDLTGKTIAIVLNPGTTVDVSHLQTGWYVFRFEVGEKVVTKRLMKD